MRFLAVALALAALPGPAAAQNGKEVLTLQDAVALAVSKLGMTNPIAITTYDALIGNFTPDGKLNASGLAGYAKALPDLGIATTAPKQSSYMTTTIVGK